MTSRKIPESAVENLVSDLEGKANVSLSNLSAAGQAKFDAKANVSNTVTTDTAQTISGVKTFSDGTLKALRPILLKEDNANEGGQIHFQRSNNSVLKADPYIDLLVNTIRFIGISSQNSTNITLQVELENNQVWVPTPALTANDNQAATTAWVRNFLTPTGAIIIWSAPTPPAGYLICDGAAISRTTYASLFNVIGTTWGAGDGNTTFNIPNLYLLSDIKVKGYTALGLTTYSAPNVPSSNIGNIYRFNEPAGASGPFVMFNQNVQNQGIGLTSDVNNTGLAYQKTTFQTKFCIRY